MITSKQIIILGGGSSLTNLINQGLWSKIQNSFTIGVNYSFRDFDSTILCTSDYGFYIGEVAQGWAITPRKKIKLWNKKLYDPCFYAELTDLPLIIAPNREDMRAKRLFNTIFLPFATHTYHGRESLLKGVYKIELSGLWALGVAVELLQGEGEIFLLGYDFGDIGTGTHYYEHSNHRGVGYTGWYDKEMFRVDSHFNCWRKEKDIKIYNVSLSSKINCLPKLTSDCFFTKIKELPESQVALRNQTRYFLKPYSL